MEKNKGGRPKKKIDKKQFEELCQIQCTREEICAVLDCDEVTLNRWCKETYDGNSFSSLRRKRWKLADTNATMAIFLGKQFLEQKDNVEVKTNAIEDLTTLADMLGFNKKEDK